MPSIDKGTAVGQSSMATSPILRSESISEEGTERMQEPADGEESRETLTSGLDMAVAHINSQKMWLHAQDLHKSKPVRFQHEWKMGPHGPILGRRAIGSLQMLRKGKLLTFGI